MRLFFNTRNRRTEEQFRKQKIDSSVLMRVMAFAEEIAPLKRPSSVRVELVDSASSNVSGAVSKTVPHYLLIFSGEEEYGYMNAGYAAGQLASYLHFLGISAQVQLGLEPWMYRQAAEGEKCMAAVAFGRADAGASHGKKKKPVEHPCISREYREDWAEEVMDFTKKSFPIRTGSVRVLCRNNCICFIPKNFSGRKTVISELETGIAAANVMSAAEELWIDLVPVDTGDPRCMISLCRRKDRAGVMKERRNTFSGGRRKPVLEAPAS